MLFQQAMPDVIHFHIRCAQKPPKPARRIFHRIQPRDASLEVCLTGERSLLPRVRLRLDVLQVPQIQGARAVVGRARRTERAIGVLGSHERESGQANLS